MSHFAISSEADGSRSEGFSTNALPQTSAIGNIHIGTIAGKLNGVMPAQTPTGWRCDQLSTFVPTFSLNSPFSICGMPQANSTTSRPRPTSPLASSKVLPCSSDIMRARSSMRFSIRVLRLNITRWRRSGGVAAQASCAFFASCTAASTSATEAKATEMLVPGIRLPKK